MAVADRFGMSAREWAVGGLDIAVVSNRIHQPGIRKLTQTLYAAAMLGRMSWRVTKVKVDELVEEWLEAIVALSTAHDPDERDAADSKTDELLTPLLTAPIKQVRQLAGKLSSRLREDERVPFVVWSAFQNVVLPLLKDSPDGKIIELKKQLATEVAELVEKDLPRDDFVQAMVGALQWRGPEALDVPDIDEQPGFTRLLGQGAIYAINFVSEDLARQVARHHRPRPVMEYELARLPSPDDDDGPF